MMSIPKSLVATAPSSGTKATEGIIIAHLSVMGYLIAFIFIMFHSPVYASVKCEAIFSALAPAAVTTRSVESKSTHNETEILQLLKETSYEGLLSGLHNAKFGKGSLEHWTDAFTYVLARHSPQNAAVIGVKIQSRTTLTDAEYKQLFESSIKGFRAAQHIQHREETIKFGVGFRDEAWEAIRNPKTERDRLWKEVGFIPLEEKGSFRWPTIFEVATKLRAYQNQTRVPAKDQIGLTHVYREVNASEFSYHSLADPLPGGTDLVPGRKSVLSTKDFHEMLGQGLMAIERGTHDLAHAMVWSRHPKVFKAVKALGRKHLENPKDEPLYVRLEWAAEVFALPNSTGTLLKSEFWTHVRKLKVTDAMEELKKQIAQIGDERIMAYAKTELIPQFTARFEPYSASAEQYGEMGATAKPARQVERYYSERTADSNVQSSDGLATKYKARDILEEQPSNMVHELKWLMSSDAERIPFRIPMIRDLITRMEFSLGMFSSFDPAQVITLMGGTQSERFSSDFAEVLRLVRGNDSTLYRVFID